MIKGYTLIELLVTLAILGILSTLLVPTSHMIVKRRQEQELRDALRQIRQAIDAYKLAYDQGHITKVLGETGYPKTLESLVDGVPDLHSTTNVKQYFLRRLPRDPFNVDTSLNNAQSWGQRSYASEPDQPHEGNDIYDVYSLSDQRGSNGIPYRNW